MVTFLCYTIFAIVGHEIKNPHIHLAMWIFFFHTEISDERRRSTHRQQR